MELEEAGKLSSMDAEGDNVRADDAALATRFTDMTLENPVLNTVPASVESASRDSNSNTSPNSKLTHQQSTKTDSKNTSSSAGSGESRGDSQSASASVESCLKPEEKEASPVAGVHVRVVLQQCTSAKLAIQPASEAENPETVQIQRGTIVYLCFLKGATKTDVEKIAKLVLSVRLSESEDGKLMSVTDLPGDILVIPQATLGGTLKGKVMQYHKNIAKDEGQQLYAEFISILKNTYETNKKCASAGRTVCHGTYGIRQVFSCTTNGPYTHLIEM